MRNHIALKFIAIILCAAALLGIVACGAGIAVLTGLDLYDRPVAEVYREQIENRGHWFAQNVAVRYSDTVLGGMPLTYIHQEYGDSRYFDPMYMTYELFDAEGNLLSVEEPLVDAMAGPAGEGADTFTFPVAEGKYAYLVSAVPDSQRASETAPGSLEPTTDPGFISLEQPPELGEPVPVDEMPAAEPAALSEDSGEDTAEDAPEDVPEASQWKAEDTESSPEGAPETAAETAPPETAPAETVPVETAPPETVPVTEPEGVRSAPQSSVPAEPQLINGKPLSEYQLNTGRYYDYELDQQVTVTYVLLDSPAYTVKVHLQPGAMAEDAFLPALSLLRGYRNLLLPGLAVSLLLFAALAVYLCCAAGRKPKSEEVRAGGLNRIPLELYAGVLFLSVGVVGWIYVEGLGALLRQNLTVAAACAGGLAYLACLIFVGFCFAVAAQLKTPGWFWLKNSLCGWCIRMALWAWHLLLNTIVWLAHFLEKKVLPFLGRILKGIWRGIKAVCARTLHGVQRFLDLLPITWQWLVVCFALLLLFLIGIAARSVFIVLLAIFASLAAVIYGSHAFGVLLETTRRMSKGDLHARIEDNLLFGCFRDFARTLNALANVAVVAAQKQLKSERMKTELITNVSHDIKTPLTSIISYADLLQKPHTPEEEQQYLEVLGRQSMQLKKLIEDLIEMSKASTGNMTVDITQVDAVEAVNQALGEFSDKLDAAMLTPVFRHSDDTAPMMADGKLVWRVLHNLLSNAVKYALPGTRLYVDMLCLEGKVILSMKNVSRDELNIDAEELMERFVRGDGSRNTEGSGLGLNIAKSMMELQHGSLQLLVDGDLFKVTLIFPGA